MRTSIIEIAHRGGLSEEHARLGAKKKALWSFVFGEDTWEEDAS